MPQSKRSLPAALLLIGTLASLPALAGSGAIRALATTRAARPARPSTPGEAHAGGAPTRPGATPLNKTRPKLSAKDRRRRQKVRTQALAMLAKLLRSPPGPVRYKLIDAIIDLGGAAWPAVQGALPRVWKLKDPEPVAVDLMLGFMPGSYDILIATEPRLSDGASSRVFNFVSRQLEPDDRLYRLLASMMKRSEPQLLVQVLGELLQRRWPGAVDRAIELIDHGDPTLRAYVVDELANMRSRKAQPFLIRRLGVEQGAATDDNLTFRIKLINAIARIGGNSAVAPLIEALPFRDQRKPVLDGLRLVGMPAVKAAVFMLTTADGVRIETAFAILEHLRILAAPELIRLLASGSDSTRRMAADVLADLHVPGVREQLLRMVRDDRFVDIRDGIRLAVSMYDASVRELLFDLLEQDKRPAVRAFVVDQLWRLRDPKTFRVLRSLAASDKDQKVRLIAMRAVAGVGDPRGPRLLRRMLTVPYVEQRLALLEMLGRVGTWQLAVPAIAQLLGDPNHRVFLAALGALRRMTFHSGPQRTAGWLAWHKAERDREPLDYEIIRPLRRRFVVGDREMGYLEVGHDRPTIVVVAGPPFRDATHLAPQVWQLADDHRVVVMQRAPGPYEASRASYERRTRELQGLLGRLGERPVMLLTDATGAHFALTFARKHPRDVSRVILHGAFWPTSSGLERAIGQIDGAIRAEMRDDLTWGFSAHWRVPAAVRHRTIFRAALSGLLGNWELGRRVRTHNLADDAFEPGVLDRVRAELRRRPIRRVRCRVLVLLGGESPWAKTTAAAVGALRGKSKRHVKLVTIPRAGWMPLLENPRATLDAVDDWLD